MNALDCELGASIHCLESMNSRKMCILEKCEFWKNVIFGKMEILEKCKKCFWELVTFGFTEFLESECVAWACRMIFHSCFTPFGTKISAF